MLNEIQKTKAVISSLFLPTLSGRFEALNIPDIKGRYGFGVQGGFINRVGSSTLSDQRVEDTIQAVIKHFEALNQSFSWYVTDIDTPESLAASLQSVGFEPGLTFAGMVLSELDQAFPMHPQVTVKPASADERHLVSDIYQTGFMPDKAAADLFADMIEIPTMTHYLVYLTGIDEPVGATSAFYIQDYQAVVLEASLILEEYRGKGIYKSLIAQRLDDARTAGMKIALVQAIKATSAPALQKLGFIEKCTIQSWNWVPNSPAN